MTEPTTEQPTPRDAVFAALLLWFRTSKYGAALSGRKTYILAAIGILQSAYALFTGEVATFDNPVPVTPEAAQGGILISGGLATLRMAMAKLQSDVRALLGRD